MNLNIFKLANYLKLLSLNGLSKDLNYLFYKNKPLQDWNDLLFNSLLNIIKLNQDIDSIDIYLFYKIFDKYIEHDDIKNIYNMINVNQSIIITYNIFNNFLYKLSFNDYNNIMSCLEQTNGNDIICEGIQSPNDYRDWIYNSNIDYNKNNLPIILDYRQELLSIRNQGDQGTCYAQSAACMKEWQEKRDYNLNEYLSPQFFYNNRDNLYDLDNNNNNGMFGRNVMKLLCDIGICLEKSYPYGTIENKNKISNACYEEAKKHKIKGYARVNSLESLKYSLKYNGLCLIAFPIYNYTNQMWIQRRDDKFLGGHAMTVVGYLEDCFIIRNSWGNIWGDNGYCYYYFRDWGKHWEIWTTVDIKGSKYIKPTKKQIDEKIEEQSDEKIEEQIEEQKRKRKSKNYNILDIIYKYIIDFLKYLKILNN